MVAQSYVLLLPMISDRKFYLNAKMKSKLYTFPLKGQFLYGKEGTKIPSAAKLTPTKDAEVCGKNQLFDETLTVNPKNRGVANVVLWVFKPKAIHDDYKKAAKDIIKLDNIGCRFEPHVLAVRTGQTLEIGNSDTIGHNSKVDFLKNLQVNPIIPAGGKVEVKPTKAEPIPINVSCSIHPWMNARVLVQDHPYMVVTDADGKFELKNLPAGKLTLKVWHEPKYIPVANIDGKDVKWGRGGRYKIELKDGEVQDHTYILDPKTIAAK